VADPVDVASKPIDIVLADDHAMVRTGLRMLLEAEPDFKIVAEAGDVESAVEQARAHQPRILLLDVNMRGEPSLPAIPTILEASSETAIVVLTMQDDPDYARWALTAGASGYVLKEAAEAELVEAVRAAARGRTYLNPALGAQLARKAPEPIRRPAAAPVELGVGSTFAGHRIDALAGSGGMGTVFRATDLTLDRPVALKVIAPEVARDPVFRERFARECRVAALLDHPNVVPVYHAGEDRGLLYLTMRYVEGTDLRSLLRQEGALEAERALLLVDQIAQALDAAHQHGLVHRDVKPANVLIGNRGGREHAFLTDFGVTKERMTPSDLTRTGFAMGTADYIAPEQAKGAQVDARADVYALGCVLFQTLSGSVPYDRDSDVDKMWAHVHEPPPALEDVRPDLPPALDDVLARALAKDPDARQQSAGRLAAEALAALRGDR
jgi:DNA-binding NarL/FixJ family response regulator/predicted Ser/Thr protein kinase